MLEDNILGEAGDLMGDLLDGLDVGLDFASGLERFTNSMGGLLERLQQFKRETENAKE